MRSKKLIPTFFLGAIVLCSSCALNNPNEGKAVNSENAETVSVANAPKDLIERGRYLVLVGGCAHCHSPKKMTEHGPEPDMDRFMMGYPADQPLPKYRQDEISNGWILMNGDLTATIGPWGITYAANLTPHETGIGNWSYDHFKRALVEGKYKGEETTRMLMPPMPWQDNGQMSDEDMRAMFAYLQSLKPIENVVPAYTPPTAMK